MQIRPERTGWVLDLDQCWLLAKLSSLLVTTDGSKRIAPQMRNQNHPGRGVIPSTQPPEGSPPSRRASMSLGLSKVPSIPTSHHCCWAGTACWESGRGASVRRRRCSSVFPPYGCLPRERPGRPLIDCLLRSLARLNAHVHGSLSKCAIKQALPPLSRGTGGRSPGFLFARGANIRSLGWHSASIAIIVPAPSGASSIEMVSIDPAIFKQFRAFREPVRRCATLVNCAAKAPLVARCALLSVPWRWSLRSLAEFARLFEAVCF